MFRLLLSHHLVTTLVQPAQIALANVLHACVTRHLISYNKIKIIKVKIKLS
jgi:hypothetical protein